MVGAIVLLGALASVSVLASEMPRAWAWPLAAAAAAYSGWRARAEIRKPAQAWFWPGTDWPTMVDGVPADELTVTWRGPWVFVRWRDAKGRRQAASWWPDTLPPERRRELRLAVLAAQASRSGASVAP